LIFGALGLLFLVGPGCGKKLPTYPVKGTVIFNKKPLKGVQLQFWRDAPGEQKAPSGSVLTKTEDDEAGKWETSLEKGTYKITVSRVDVYDPIDPKELKRSDLNCVLKETYGIREKTPLSVNVTEKGADKVDLFLRTPDEPPPP